MAWQAEHMTNWAQQRGQYWPHLGQMLHTAEPCHGAKQWVSCFFWHRGRPHCLAAHTSEVWEEHTEQRGRRSVSPRSQAQRPHSMAWESGEISRQLAHLTMSQTWSRALQTWQRPNSHSTMRLRSP